MQWIYTEYFSIYTQYLGYFASVLMLLTSAAAISIIRVANKSACSCAISFFCLSLVLSVINIWIIFEIYDGLRTTLLLMSGKCSPDFICDINIQDGSTYLKVGIVFAILSFLLLTIGWIFKVKSRDE